jgi:outer membrane protein OmpA-like peptidoglycan-associated protein
VVIAPVLPILAAQPTPTPPGPTPAPLRFPTAIHFGFNKVRVNQHQVMAIARALRGRRQLLGVRVDGYTDDLGALPYNLRLSHRRACNVAAGFGNF